MKGYFLDVLDENIELNQLESYFKNYDKKDWKYSNSGVLSFKEHLVDVKLFFIHHLELGFSFRYDMPDNKSYYSVNNIEYMHEFVDTGDEEFVPKGSFVKLEVAWQIITAFFNRPQEQSDKINWIIEEDIDWSNYEGLH